jgi:hypothetical protein
MKAVLATGRVVQLPLNKSPEEYHAETREIAPWSTALHTLNIVLEKRMF